MTILAFPTAQLLEVALRSQAISSEKASKPAEIARSVEGELEVRFQSRLEDSERAALKVLGVVPRREPRMDSFRTVSCWPEMLPTTTGHPPALSSVLFVSAVGPVLGRLVASLLRLGCDRQQFCFFEGGNKVVHADQLANPERASALGRVVDPPYLTVLEALESESDIEVFSPTSVDRVWCSVGVDHPLMESLRAPDGKLLLVRARGPWGIVPDGPWEDFYDRAAIAVGTDQTLPSSQEVPPFQVTLELGRSARVTDPCFWVLREAALERAERIVAGASEQLLAELEFAILGSEPIVAIRARSSSAPPWLELGAESYAPLGQLPNLFVPTGRTIEPPLSHRTLNELLASDADQIAWLVPEGSRGFRTERCSVDAFRPLRDWVEYVMDRNAQVLEGWMRSAVFEFESFLGADRMVSEGAPRANPRRLPRAHALENSEPPKTAAEKPAKAKRRGKQVKPEPSPSEPQNPRMEELAALEERFCALQEGPDHDETIALWGELARANLHVERPRQAALCFSHAIWEAEEDDAARLARQWAQAEARMVGPAPTIDVAPVLSLASPTPAQVRAVVSHVIAARRAGEGVEHSAGVRAFFDQWAEGIETRALWLGTIALSEASGGDALGLVRSRDTILRRLRRGLSLSRDVPRFVRLRGSGTDSYAGEQLGAILELAFDAYQKVKRRPSAIEAPRPLTDAYVSLLFAWGWARLGRAEATRELEARARGNLDGDDAIHAYLLDAFANRIRQAEEGLPVEAPPSAQIRSRLEALARFDRYKIDRLRDASSILEWTGKLDPFQAFHARANGEQDPTASIALLEDKEEAAILLGKLLEEASTLRDPDRFEHRCGLVIDQASLLPDQHAVPLLTAAAGCVQRGPASAKLSLIDAGLRASGQTERRRLVGLWLEDLAELADGVREASAAADVSTVVACNARVLRRTGHVDRGREVLGTLHTTIASDAIETQLELAVAMATLGESAELEQALPSAMSVLETLDLSRDTALLRQVSRALGRTSPAQVKASMERLMPLLTRVTDSFNTNSHFCLSVLRFMDAIVLACVNDELTLSDWGSQFVDESEHRVRLRIHRDMVRSNAKGS